MQENAGEIEARRAGKGQRSQQEHRVFPNLNPDLQCGQGEGVCRPILCLASANLAMFTPRVPLPGPSRATLSRLCFLKTQPHFLRTETRTLLSLTHGWSYLIFRTSPGLARVTAGLFFLKIGSRTPPSGAEQQWEPGNSQTLRQG